MELLKQSAKIRGLCIKRRVDTDWNCPKKWEYKRVYALIDGWTITGIAKKVQK